MMRGRKENPPVRVRRSVDLDLLAGRLIVALLPVAVVLLVVALVREVLA